MEKLLAFYSEMVPYFDWVRCSSEVRDFIICQFALESSFGKSRLAHDCHNYCGMRYPLVRIATCCDKDNKSGFASYPSLYYCIVDYFLCLQYHSPLREDLENVESFKCFLKKFYCPEIDYIDKITYLFNQLNSYKNGKK